MKAERNTVRLILGTGKVAALDLLVGQRDAAPGLSQGFRQAKHATLGQCRCMLPATMKPELRACAVGLDCGKASGPPQGAVAVPSTAMSSQVALPQN